MNSPKKIGPYRIDGLLGQGGMGEVYLAYDEQLDRAVAIKKIRASLLSKAGAVERFRREARSMAKLQHPSIVQVFNLFEENDYLYLVMEYVEGRTVTELVGEEGPLSPTKAAKLFGTISEGLAEAHAQGIVHRDIKAQNLMVTGEDRGKILDFGLAKHLQTTETTLSVAGRIVGTPRTMSPEQSRGEAVGHSSDLFSLGAVLYEAVTGQAPFQGDQLVVVVAKISMEHPPAPVAIDPSIPRPLSNLIMRLLEKEPEQRPESAIEVAKELAAISGDTALSGSAVSSGEEVPSRGAVEVVDPAPALLQATRVDDSDLPTLEHEPAETPGKVESRAETRPLGPKSKFRTWALGIFVLLIATIAFMAWQRSPDFPDEIREGSDIREPSESEAMTVSNPPSAIAVLDLENLTGDPEKDWIGTALAEMLRAGLQASSGFRIVDGAESAWAGRQFIKSASFNLEDEILLKIQRGLGADLVIGGRFSQLANGPVLEIEIQVQEAGASKLETWISSPGKAEELASAVGRLSPSLRQRLNIEEPTTQQKLETRASFPSNPEVARLYAEGLRLRRGLDSLGAIRLFQAAVSIDAHHPMPHAALAEAWSSLGYEKKASEATMSAWERAQTEDLPLRLRKNIEAQDYLAREQWSSAEDIYDQLYKNSSGDLALGLKLVETQLKSKGSLRALATLEGLRELPTPAGEDPRIDLAEARIRFDGFEIEEMLAATERAARKSSMIGAPLLLAESRLRQATALFYSEGRSRETLEALQEAKKIFDEFGDRYGAAKALETTAHVYSRQGDQRGAQRLFELALATYSDIGNSSRAASVNDSLGAIFFLEGRLQEALAVQQKALDTVRELDDKDEISFFSNNIGSTLLRMGDWKRSGEKFDEALTIAESLPNHSASALTLTSIGELHFNQGELLEAKVFHEKALAINRLIFSEGTAYDTFRLGLVSRMQGDLHVARERYEEALEIQNELEDQLRITEIEIELARLDLAEGNWSSAVAFAGRAEEIAREAGWSDIALLARVTFAWARYELGDSEEAANLFAAALAGAEASEDPGVRLEVMVIAARGRALLGVVELPAAIEQLRRLAKEAETAGYVQHAFEARLAAGELSVRNGEPGASAELAALEHEAKQKGYGLIARQAAKARRH